MTKCSICEHANPPLVRQCENCGMQLMRDDDSTPAADNELQMLIDSGKKIDAIKLYRERTGLGLAEAKDAVEAMMRGEMSTAVPPPLDRPFVAEQEVVALLRDGRKIEAIKLYREQAGGGLRDAKLAVDHLAREHGIEAAGSGCLGLLAAGLFLAAATGYIAS